jgi:lipoprotein-releasing system permease protein
MFRVVGVFEFGFHDFDADLVLVDLRAVQSFINRGNVVTGIDVRLTDPLAAPAIAREITGRLTAGAYQALTWHEINRNLFESLKINKMWLAIIMTCMVVVASFNILSTLILMVLDKTKEIAILKSMGASRSGIMRVFVLQGLVVGVVGTLLGLAGGVVVCQLIEQINFGLDPAVYKISSLTVDMRLMEFIVVGVVAVLISFVATLYPSWRAGRLSPVDGLRYD